jgi:hypothetical protein
MYRKLTYNSLVFRDSLTNSPQYKRADRSDAVTVPPLSSHRYIKYSQWSSDMSVQSLKLVGRRFSMTTYMYYRREDRLNTSVSRDTSWDTAG